MKCIEMCKHKVLAKLTQMDTLTRRLTDARAVLKLILPYIDLKIDFCLKEQKIHIHFAS